MEQVIPRFEGEVSVATNPDPARGRRRRLTIHVSLAAHSLALGGVLLLPLLSSDLPDPATDTARAFFAGPALAPPPPPPPPPARAAARLEARPTAPQTTTFTAPAVTPEEVAPESGDDLGLEGGVVGGVEGGTPGGVVGGIVGGLPEAASVVEAVRVGGAVKEPRKLKHVDPIYPPLALSARIHGLVILEATLSPEGRVTDLRVLRGLPMLDAAAIEAVKQWVYTPTLLNGVPVPLIMTITVQFQLS
jgi:protein TonB